MGDNGSLCNEGPYSHELYSASSAILTLALVIESKARPLGQLGTSTPLNNINP